MTVTTAENVEKVKEFYQDQPSTSQRKAAKILDIGYSSLRKIMDSQLKLFLYKIQVHQPLSDYDITRRLEFANDMFQLIETKQIDPKKIFFTDEAHFHLDGYVNKQNYRHWGTEQPHLAIARSLHPLRVTVWCAITYGQIIGPIFITKTIDRINYREDILENFFRQIRQKKMIDGYWFQQDGARPHRTPENLSRIAEVFGDRIIGLDALEETGGGITWPPYSADMTVCDYFLWGCVKDKVYQDQFENLEQLKDRIKQVIDEIPVEQINSAMDNFLIRLKHLITIEGKHFENLIN